MSEQEGDSDEGGVDGWNLPKLDRELPRLRFTVSPLNLLALTLMAVVASMLIAPNFVRARAQGRGSPCKSNLKNIGTALEMYSTDWSGHYPTSMNALTPNYLRAIPECPAADAMSYRAHFGLTAPLNTGGYEDYYYIECYGENHIPLGVTGNYPAYSGIQGLIERAP